MFRHNLLIVYRSFLRSKSSFLINIFGLTVGIACALFIFLWVSDELKIDAFHQDRLFQVMQEVPMADGTLVADGSPGPLAEALVDEMPEIERALTTKMAPPGVFDGIIIYAEAILKARPQYAGREFFEVFSFPLIHGDKYQVLDDPYNIVISESLAKALFGSTTEAMGKTVQWEKKIGEIINFSGYFTVSGIFNNEAEKSSDPFDVLFSFDYFLEKSPQTSEWYNDQATTFVVVRDDANLAELDEKITALIGGKREAQHQFFLQKYTSRYLYNNYENGSQAGGRIEYLWLFSLIALVIIVIASINFMNLSTAKATLRMKEIGTKKTIGATRQQLIAQFISESVIISLAAFVMAVLVVYVLMPQFNQITGKQLSLVIQPSMWMLLLCLALLIGLFSSLYPALYLSSFNPIQVLKGKISISFSEIWTRKVLVVFQFSVSVVLIVFVLVIFQQMDYIHTKNLGYDRENVISVHREGDLDKNLEQFLAEVKGLPGVVNATNGDSKLIEASNFTWGIDWPGRDPDEYLQVNPFLVNYEYLETFDIELHAGRSFSKAYGSDDTKVILNESAVRAMGLESPVGTPLTIWDRQVEVIGVAEDFHYQSLYKNISPCFFLLFEEGNNYGLEISIKVRSENVEETVEQIAQIYEAYNPGYPFEFSFLDEDYQAVYEAESRTALLSRLFAALAILISCLGLFGLATFTAERRTKEIGIRKIMGASMWSIMRLLTGDFTKMIVSAIAIAMPVSFVVARHWLEGFNYSVDLHWWYFGGAAAIILLIAWLTVSLQTVKASRVNPTDCLQYE